MEGASQLRSVREIWGCLPEYWQTGKPRLEATHRRRMGGGRITPRVVHSGGGFPAGERHWRACTGI